MRVVLIVGQSNVGKTLLMIRLAERFGIRTLKLETNECRPLDRTLAADLRMGKAVEVLTGSALNQTRSLQSVLLPGSVRRGLRLYRLRLVDSVGLSDRIHPDAQIRRGMADTLRELSRASLVLHVVDASKSLLEVSEGIRRCRLPGHAVWIRQHRVRDGCQQGGPPRRVAECCRVKKGASASQNNPRVG